jgi:hypothetical protein
MQVWQIGVVAGASALAWVAMVLLAARCGPADVVFTFENETHFALCDFHSAAAAAASECLAEMAPQETTTWGRDCDNQTDRPIRMVIAVKRDRRVIYDKTASSGEWDDHSTIVIRQIGSDLVVTDELEP